MKKNIFVDFDAGMSKELKQAVYATQVCRKYLRERKRMEALAKKQSAKDRLSEECAQLNELIAELEEVIKKCKRELDG